MRWLNRTDKKDSRRRAGRHERGATTVFITVSLVGLLAMTAFSFDFGRVYIERRQLQTGAEAAALAVARDCAKGACIAAYDVMVEADIYADANSPDGMSWIQEADLDMAAQRVRVVTGNEDANGNRNFDMVFGRVVGVDEFTVGAEATAVWGPPGKIKALPLIYSECEWESFGNPGFVDENPVTNFLHRSSAVETGLITNAAYPYRNKFVTIRFHGQGGNCHYSPSGQDLPGGFGWLDTGTNSGSVCALEVASTTWSTIDPGASPSNGCDPIDLYGMIGSVQLIPYFDKYDGTGNNAKYRVSGFGAFFVTGYYFSGQFKEKSIITGQFPCGGSNRCIQGYFIGDWVAAGGSDIGGGNDHGLNIIGLAG